MKISMKVWRIQNEVMLAACDSNLLGKRFEEGELHIEIKREFYHESFVTEKAFRNALKMATIINLVGENVIRIAVEEGIIDRDNIIRISSVPHAQAVVMLYWEYLFLYKFVYWQLHANWIWIQIYTALEIAQVATFWTIWIWRDSHVSNSHGKKGRIGKFST